MLTEKYNFQETEYKYNILWEESKIYKWCGSKDNSFVIDTPPPTISGKLHIGHIFSYCHTDFIARYQRMIGKDVFYPIGFDDNGLPTERLVEQISKACAAEVERSEFTQMCKEVSSKSRQEFKKLFQATGISYDWELEYHTIGKKAVKLSQMSFIDLYNKGYIYRKLEPILWDTIDQTAIAQAEVEDKIFPSLMHTISFFTEDNQKINIATTRPELLSACVAIFCHPEDSRYSHLIGKCAITPLFQNKVPILADDKVKIEKGTGLVMCCTFGDETDVYWWRKHNLPTKTIISKSGKISGTMREIDGLSIKKAREKIVEILTIEKFLVKSEEIAHSVKCAERSGAELEILLTYQWFIKVLEYKNELLAKVRKCNWHPKSMQKRMEIWIEGLNWDWCISRQRYFGVQLPVWYSQRKGEEGKTILPEIEDLPIDPLKDLPRGYSREEVIAEKDVMDTWATSALTPQLNALAINEEFTVDNILFPADLRPQSHEIIRTWAFYTIVKSHYHANSIPWRNIMISGWCLAHDKKKMSKSKGNVITPDSILNIYGADVVRYWAANSRLGVDTTFSEDIFKTGKRLITKIWNASKFVSSFMQKHQELDISSVTQTMDKWIISHLYKTTKKVTEKFEHFQYCEALDITQRFFWDDLCDNYLEFIKKRAYGKDASREENLSARQSLAYVLNVVLRFFAPFFPYITEEIYHKLYSYNSIHNLGNWPKIEDSLYDAKAEAIGKNCVEILNAVRKLKADSNISVKCSVKKLSIKAKDENFQITQSAEKDLKAVCNAEIIEWNDNIHSGLETEKFVISIELASV
ncbi:valine--tRNA ligase [Candidatus Mesenet endosymbiont of Agriotes lineatus]|uniref:valine--tRNA ligase n=1 Tax=Candidatus Mesenet endosymbiont of Agriotes lineatus TaxID=3077948 RepID=UPI0030D56A1E